MHVVIIGAGASGMMAALSAAQAANNTVTVLERQARVGRKLLATGNGRCNLSNLQMDPSHYHGGDPSFVRPALEALCVQSLLTYFAQLGLLTVSEPSGRLYPCSDQANSVVDVLRFAMEQHGVQVLTGCEVTKLWKKGQGFLLKTTQQDVYCDKLIVACGGAAGSKLGGGLSGYALLKSLGHHATGLFPALVQLKTGSDYPRSLKGVRAQAQVQLLCGQDVLAQSQGEVQFTEFGLSGPAVFDISRTASCTQEPAQIRLDFLPDYTYEQVLELILCRCARFPGLMAENLLTGMLHNRLGRVVVSSCAVPHQTALPNLSQNQKQSLAQAVKDFTLPYLGPLGMDCAQVTAGGIVTREFDPETLESCLVPGLYACGEVLDIDGDCGGYNLQWAWSSGYLAGKLLTRS